MEAAVAMLNGHAPSNNGNGTGPAGPLTYSEVRRVARWMEVFTAWDLADVLGVPVELGDQFVKALLFHGLARDTREWADGPRGVEAVYEMDPLVPDLRPRERRTPPEIVAILQMGGFLLYDARGVPVRIRTERRQRRALSTPGSRQHHKDREREWQRQEDARKRVQEVSERKRVAQSQGKQYIPASAATAALDEGYGGGE